MEQGDTVLLDLIPFLEAVVKNNVQDVRSVIKSYEGQDIATAYRQAFRDVAHLLCQRQRCPYSAVLSYATQLPQGEPKSYFDVGSMELCMWEKPSWFGSRRDYHYMVSWQSQKLLCVSSGRNTLGQDRPPYTSVPSTGLDVKRHEEHTWTPAWLVSPRIVSIDMLSGLSTWSLWCRERMKQIQEQRKQAPSKSLFGFRK